jgi:flagellar hook assembly protein FlgD
MTLSSSRVSPDCDGFEDVVSVDVFPGGNDNVITVTVFSDRGYIVRRLADRFAAGEGSRFVWDGTTDAGARLPAGLYMIMAETYNTEGVSERWKEICALLYR